MSSIRAIDYNSDDDSEYENEFNSELRPLGTIPYLQDLTYLHPANKDEFLNRLYKLVPGKLSDIEPSAWDRTNIIPIGCGPLLLGHISVTLGRTLSLWNSDMDCTICGTVLGMLWVGDSDVQLEPKKNPARQLSLTTFFVGLDVLHKTWWLLLNIEALDELGYSAYTDFEDDDEWPTILPVLGEMGLTKVRAIKIANNDWANENPEEPGFAIQEVFIDDAIVKGLKEIDLKKAAEDMGEAYPWIKCTSDEIPRSRDWHFTRVRYGRQIRRREKAEGAQI